MKKYSVLFLLSLFLVFGIFVYQNASFNDGKLHLTICNTGQGDAILIRTPKGSDILIDGGPDNTVLDCLAKHLPFWDRTIELIVLTHPHADHLNGLISVLERYNSLYFVTEKVSSSSALYKKLEKVLALKKIKTQYSFKGDKINFSDGVVLKTLWPEKNWLNFQSLSLAKSDLNGLSLVNLLSFKNFKVLLTGDAGFVVEEKIAQNVGKIAVLKVPHHGSKTGLSSLVLESIKPDLAVISVGAKNSYGHPAKSALDLLSKFGIKTLRTDKDGEVEIVTDGKTFTVH